MNQGKHLTLEGLQKIINIRAVLNKGSTPLLKEAFPNAVPIDRPLCNENLNLEPQWIAGFASGDGSFKISIKESNAYKTGYNIALIFVLTQHIRDEVLLKNIFKFFECGHVYSYKEHSEYVCQSFKDIESKILPFFIKNPVLGVKYLDFKDWCKVAELIKQKAHLTNEGINLIRQIKAGMNKGINIK